MKVNLLYWGTVLFVVSCVGCSSTKVEKQMYMSKQHLSRSAQYNAGYAVGCASGLNKIGQIQHVYAKDNARFVADKEYRNGWNEGFAICQQEYIAEIQGKVKQDVGLGAGSKKAVGVRKKIWDELKK